ncbi:DNA polymerase delta subunit 3-like [Diachasma alloeum]|uniref:DNA polymerase delta subunit 3-like n=1 Tax=Diachasma alloeum TaxID=454923 RepID=UPI000738497D|nr:DNA polymerase delta subunit 3-like [Diachasma alloeum]
MVKAPMEVYRQTLAGYIHDDDKFVTYKWLSKELEVHVNTAKEILADYWEKHKDDGIVATVMLIGNLKDGGIRVEVVRASDLEEATKKYEKIISQHLYSLQKTLPDIQSLVNAGKGDVKFSAIKCKDSTILSDEELFSRRWGASLRYQAPFDEKNQPPPPPAKVKEPVNPLKKAFANSKPAEEKEKDEEKEKQKDTNKAENKTEAKKVSPPGKSGDKKGTISKKPVQSTQKGFSDLFGKVQNQKKSPPSTSSGTKPYDVTKTPPQENSKSKDESPMDVDVEIIEGKSSQQSKNEKSTIAEDESPELVESPLASSNGEPKKSSPLETKKIEKKSSPPEVKKSSANGSTKPEKSKKSTRGKKRERSQDSHNDSKKRKRIVVVSDSSEDSEPEEDPDPFGSSITEEPVEKVKSPSPPPVQRITGKRTVRKFVDKHFVDEDGFMVTKKVQIVESCSEDDETPEPPKEKKPSPPKTSEISKAKKNTKQPSITNFFKKS